MLKFAKAYRLHGRKVRESIENLPEDAVVGDLKDSDDGDKWRVVCSDGSFVLDSLIYASCIAIAAGNGSVVIHETTGREVATKI